MNYTMIIQNHGSSYNPFFINSIMNDITYLGNPNLKKANVAQNWTKEELIEYQKCMDDPQYFIQTYVKIVSLDEGLVPFKMYDYPDSLVNPPSWFPISYIMHCSTQVLISQFLQIRQRRLVTYYHVCSLHMNICQSGYSKE